MATEKADKPKLSEQINEAREVGLATVAMIKDTGSVISGSISLFSGYVFAGLDWLQGKKYNDDVEERDFWLDLPQCCSTDEGGDCTVFVKLDPETKYVFFLTPERVYYQAQLHLCLYYSLVRRTSTVEFDKIYSSARKSKYWAAYVDNLSPNLKMHVGDYAILEVCVDCVMLRHLMKRLPKRRTGLDTSVDQTQIAQVFELIYFRLLRHLSALIEAYIDLVEVEARAMMTLKTAKYLLCRSLNRQHDQSAGNRSHPPLGSPPLRTRSSSIDASHSLVDGVISTRRRRVRPSLLQEELVGAIGDNVEISSVSDIKTLHRARVKTWNEQIRTYRSEKYDQQAGLQAELEQLEYLLESNRFPIDKVYYHVHKRAYLAMGLAADIVNKTCMRLYKTKEQLEVEEAYVDGEESDEQISGEDVFNRWTSILANMNFHFQHHSPM